ncbi:hypothetical protein CONLIGDRAFT_584528 [Coniochaeta ligniaria NRRL 30616]|uniref:Uncharacterized protein n=1 Tax=Coniochaeta ligniaria NRRL 30616 TaxID=1408157 RepID=A0A1J7JAU4_9PEZI|nr:hypothetical protein CONLIGDRAFT_584528 [Coniochaeta ligniaria NRRL 30616]
METSAPKRRKTSPLTALPIESTTTTTQPDPPPPPQIVSTDAPQDTWPRSTRASYASPTKASLSRHNPDILLRRLSSPAKARAAGEGLEGSSAAGPLRSPTRQLGGALAAQPKRTPVKPNPRPLPPPGPDDDDDDDDDILNPFAGRVLRRSPLAGLAEPHPPEPELPPTPVHPDHAASTPPTGIHSTPSRRPRRSRALAEKIRSSPTKQPPAKPGADVFRHENEHILPTTETEPQPASRPRPSDVRGVEPADAEAKKKRERDALQMEVAQLERDLDVVAQENERIRQLQLSRKEVAMPTGASNILGVLGRHLGPRKNDIATSRSEAWLQAALDPIAFLPFGRPSSALPTLFPEDISSAEPEHEPLSHDPISLTAREALPFLQAFTPLTFASRVTIDPYPPRNATDEDGPESANALLQHHSITVKSASAPGLFSARIDMTVNATTHAITSLAVPSIDPPSAGAELSPLIAKILAEPEASSSALSRNVGVLNWAMGSWLRVAVRRAKVWRTLDSELGTPDALIRTAARVRATRKGRKLKWKGAASGADEHAKYDGGKDADSDGSADWIDNLVGTDDLLPYMGRLWMDFPVPSSPGGGESGIVTDTDVSVLRVQWRIEFDWTGEARSRIRAVASLPGKWHRTDERTTLAGITALFDKLLQRGGDVVPAVETIVTLLAGEQRG